MFLEVHNWAKFQHYKDRCPPWIKLSTDTFQNRDFSNLSIASKALAICIWTLASKSKNGLVPDDLGYISQWGFLTGQVKQQDLEELVDKGFLVRDSTLQAKRKRRASKVQERGEERRGEAYKTTEAEERRITPPHDEAKSGSYFLPLNDHSEFPIYDFQISEWCKLFPAVDVNQQLNSMRAWCLANPTRRKTKSGVLRFVTSWLSKEQNAIHNNGARPHKQGVLDQIRNNRRMPDFGSGNVPDEEPVEH